MSVRRLLCTMAALTLIVGSVTIATVRALPLEVASLAQIGSANRLEIRLAEAAFTPGTREAVVSGSDQRVYLHPTTLATWSDVTVARIVNQRNAGVGVAVTFSDAAAARLATATAGHLDRPVAIMLDGRVVSAPIVRSPISDSAMITGITAARAQELIDACQSSAAQCAAAVLPIPIHQERPQYTPAALQAQIQGSVLLETTVLADGSASNVKVIRSLDTELGLDQEAVKALQRWTWKPGTRSGKPADVAVQIEMTFTLK